MAASVASDDPLLDFTEGSIRRVEARIADRKCTGVDIYRLGAYAGETLRRNAINVAWSYKPRGPRTAGLAVGKALVDPFDVVERCASASPRAGEETLTGTFADLLRWARSPTPETEAELGWENRVLFPTHWDMTKERWRLRRRRWRRRQALRSCPDP